VTRVLADKELREMAVTDLIAEAEAVGITLVAAGDHLQVRGPRNAEPLGRLLLERKTEVLAVRCSPSCPSEVAAVPEHATERMAPTEVGAQAEVEPSHPLPPWDATRAAAVLAAVDSLIVAAQVREDIINNPARRNVLANEREIVSRLEQQRDPFLWNWPRALRGLLARWVPEDFDQAP
jgi:hypothetical protein